MKEIRLKHMRLENFKGARDLDVDFGYRTDICGANATGKTTLFDAFTWCLFGKDSKDRTDSGRGAFGIKGTDADGNVIGKLDHSVELVISINDVDVTLKRVMVEKWVTKNGTADVEFKGNETRCFWNGVELKISEYSRRIADEVIDDSRFKALTNPHYVCNLPWEKQKVILTELIGNVTFEDVVGDDDEFIAEIEVLRGKKMLGREEEYLKSIQASIRKEKEDIKADTQKITGMKGLIPEMPDVESLNKEKGELNRELDVIEEKRRSKAEQQNDLFRAVKDIENQEGQIKQRIADYKLGKVDALQKAYREKNEAYFEASEALDSIRRESMRVVGELRSNLERVQSSIKNFSEMISVCDQKRDELLDKWDEVNDQDFQWNDEIVCPFTKRPCDSQVTKIEAHNNRVKAEAAFNEEKDRKLEEIENLGKAVAVDLNSKREELARLNKEADEIQKAIKDKSDEYNEKISAARLREIELGKAMGERPSESTINWEEFEEVELMKSELEELKLRFQGLSTGEITVDGEEMARRAEIKLRVTEIDEQLGVVKVISEQREKVEEMEQKVADMAQALAFLEQEADVLERMRKAVDLEIQRRCDMKFRIVKWKLSETQINGGETATCYAMANGVRYSDQNSAMQVNMGLDIINSLCEHYEVRVPIFIDNAEGVNKLVETESQVVRLVVTEDRPFVIKI